MVTLYFKQGASDKVYVLDIVEMDEAGWVINFAYGRRGGTLATGTKTRNPVTKPEAQKIYDKILREKMAEGYTESENGSSYTATPNEDRFTGILPMLLNRISDDKLEHYFKNPDWIEEQKHNGKRILIQGIDGTITGINRKGLIVGIPEVIAQELHPFPGSWILDGEMVGEHYKVFDRIIPGTYLETRKASLAYMMDQREHPHIELTEYWEGETAKRAFFERAKKQNMEGVVFKHLFGYYVSGRPNSGGDAMKYKFLEDITCYVHHQNKDKRSIGVALDTAAGYIGVGNVTIPANYEVPEVGSIVEVEYLYATSGGILYQPVYKGPRTDHEVDFYSKLKFQAEESEE